MSETGRTVADPSQGKFRLASEATQTPPQKSLAVINLVKEYKTHDGPRRVLDGISFTVTPGERLAVLGRNGSGKSTLIRVVAGAERYSSGHIHRGLNLSWPLAFSGGFAGELTGYDNVRFISKLYGAELEPTVDYVANFTELGDLLYTPVKTYSNGMRARLSFALSLAIEFDCYLIDELIAVGDANFRKRCREALFEKTNDKAMLLALHNVGFVKKHCSSALVLKDGKGKIIYDTDLACAIYETL